MILKAIKTKKLSELDKVNICKLKNSNWNFGIRSQIYFFNKTYKANDIHFLVENRNILIGYNCLRKRNMFISNRKFNYFLFDTLIISKRHRKKNLGGLLMHFNNIYIKNEKMISILLCEKNLIKFYSKFGWINFNSKNIKNFKKDKYLMTFNNYLFKNSKKEIKINF